MNKIFLDNNSTTPLDPQILDRMLPFFTEKFGNPSSRTHSFGWEAEAYVEKAREHISDLINADLSEIIFTSGATESNNLAIINATEEYDNSHMITMESEHKAVLDICKSLNKKGLDITYLRPQKNGIIEIENIKNNIKNNTKIVSVMHANNEIGVIQPIKKIGELCKINNIIFHVDAAQSLGKIQIDVKGMNIDLLSLSSHKAYGPKGIGCLYINNKIKNIRPIFFGGNQERGIRPGTLPVPLIVGFGEGCKIITQNMNEESSNILDLRNFLLQKIISQIPDTIINGDLDERIAGNINISFPSLKGQSIIPKMPRIAVSSGSACTSSSPSPSHVLKSIGLDTQLINSTLRIGIGRFNTISEINIAAETIIDAVNKKTNK